MAPGVLDVNRFDGTVLHLSHATSSARDGGVAAAITDLITAQLNAGGSAEWLTAEHWPAWCRDRQLRRAATERKPALAHLHGLWRSPTRIAPALARTGLPVVVSPHGMLDPWALAHSRWKKHLVEMLWEQRALHSAVALQALCQSEADAIAATGLTAPIALIPNGVELPDPAAALPSPPWSDLLPPGGRVLLFLGRFHPKKGTLPLLMAWGSLVAEAERHGWWLAMVGYGDDGSLARMVESQGLPRCSVHGPCFGEQKAACLSKAAAFILPSFSEGLPMAALEAMSWSLPALLSPACHLPEAIAAGAALAVDPEQVVLRHRLIQLFNLSEAERSAMGAKGRELMATRFSWPRIAHQTAELYGWLLGGGEAPDFVQQPRR
ncbi:glycosyltransferase [Synechococcus sp. CS-1325]|nr:glycosyltransferase [Synechococcus sp. CS-1325]